MKESDYILVSELQRVRIARNVLRDIVVDESAVIPKGEYSEVMAKLNNWIYNLENIVEVAVQDGD